MSNETCPHCGADDITYKRDTAIIYACGNVKFLDEESECRGNRCYELQLAQKDAEIEKLLKLLKDIGDYAHNKSTGPAIEDGYWEIRRLAYDEL